MIQTFAQSIGAYQSWTPTFTGFSADPSSVNARYTLNGKMCTCIVSMGTGTSNANSFTMTLPFTARTGAGYVSSGFALGVEGASGVSSWVRGRQGSNVLDIYKSAGTTTWATSGNKSAIFCFTYEID